MGIILASLVNRPQDTLQMKERCDALKSAHEAVIERAQAEELQMQQDEQAAQARLMCYSGE